MIDWIIKKVICGKINGLLKKYEKDVVRVQLTLREWLHRIYSLTACLESMLTKIDDGELTSDEVKEVGEEVKQLVQEW